MMFALFHSQNGTFASKQGEQATPSTTATQGGGEEGRGRGGEGRGGSSGEERCFNEAGWIGDWGLGIGDWDGGLISEFVPSLQSVAENKGFQYIIRLLNTNIEGRRKVQFALTSIKGVGKRYAGLACKKADIDMSKRAGELSNEELERIVTIIQNPRTYKIPDWFLNRQKVGFFAFLCFGRINRPFARLFQQDIKDGKFSQVLSNGLENKLREDLERLKKIHAHRGLRHHWYVRPFRPLADLFDVAFY